jgi:hypothetical protein
MEKELDLEQHMIKLEEEENERTRRKALMNENELLYKQKIQELIKEIEDIEEKEKKEEGDKYKIEESRENIQMYKQLLKEIEPIRLRLNEESKENREEYNFFTKFHGDQDQKRRVREIEDEENLRAVLGNPKFKEAMREQQRRQRIIKHTNLPINIPLPPYGVDKKYEDMINDLLLKVGNPGIINFKKPTKTEAGFVKLKVLAMYCHADKPNYEKLADKLKGLFPNQEKTLYEDTGEVYNLDTILDDVCSYLGPEGGRRNKTKSKSKTKTKTSKYKKRKTNKSKKSRRHIKSRSRRPVKSRRYRKSRK